MITKPGELLVFGRKEQTELARREAIVYRGLASWLETTQSLMEIRDQYFTANGYPIYRIPDGEGGFYSGWSDYLDRRWNMSRQNYHWLVRELQASTTVDAPADATPSSLRPLIGLSADTQQEVYAAATQAAGGTPTEADVLAALSELPAEQQKERIETAEKKNLNRIKEDGERAMMQQAESHTQRFIKICRGKAETGEVAEVLAKAALLALGAENDPAVFLAMKELANQASGWFTPG